MQLELFGRSKPGGQRADDRVFSLSDDERQFIESARAQWLPLPLSFVEAIRLKRRSWTPGFWAGLLSYERSRELADEQAIILLPHTEWLRAYDPDPVLIDVLAKREAAERAKAFEAFLREASAA